MGLEPMTSRVSGERSSQLSYASIYEVYYIIKSYEIKNFEKEKRNKKTIDIAGYSCYYIQVASDKTKNDRRQNEKAQ